LHNQTELFDEERLTQIKQRRLIFK